MKRSQAPGSGKKVLKGVPVAYAPAVSMDINGARHVYCSGVTATDPTNDAPDAFVGVGSMRDQVEQIMRNIRRLMRSMGGEIEDIVRVRVYVSGELSEQDFKDIHEVRSRYFVGDALPASTLVIVNRLVRPEAKIEIDCDAVIDLAVLSSDQ